MQKNMKRLVTVVALSMPLLAQAQSLGLPGTYKRMLALENAMETDASRQRLAQHLSQTYGGKIDNNLTQLKANLQTASNLASSLQSYSMELLVEVAFVAAQTNTIDQFSKAAQQNLLNAIEGGLSGMSGDIAERAEEVVRALNASLGQGAAASLEANPIYRRQDNPAVRRVHQQRHAGNYQKRKKVMQSSSYASEETQPSALPAQPAVYAGAGRSSRQKAQAVFVRQPVAKTAPVAEELPDVTLGKTFVGRTLGAAVVTKLDSKGVPQGGRVSYNDEDMFEEDKSYKPSSYAYAAAGKPIPAGLIEAENKAKKQSQKISKVLAVRQPVAKTASVAEELPDVTSDVALGKAFVGRTLGAAVVTKANGKRVLSYNDEDMFADSATWKPTTEWESLSVAQKTSTSQALVVRAPAAAQARSVSAVVPGAASPQASQVRSVSAVAPGAASPQASQVRSVSAVAPGAASPQAPQVRNVSNVSAGTTSSSQSKSAPAPAAVRLEASPFDVLEIKSGASNADIKKAYRTLMLRYHPDKHATEGAQAQAAAQEKFLEVKDAYEKLGSPS